jgi:hypothetical protein
MSRITVNSYLAGLGEQVVADGICAHSDHVFAVARAARTVTPAATAVLVDPQESEIARSRALAVVAAAVLRGPAAARLSRVVLAGGIPAGARPLAA